MESRFARRSRTHATGAAANAFVIVTPARLLTAAAHRAIVARRRKELDSVLGLKMEQLSLEMSTKPSLRKDFELGTFVDDGSKAKIDLAKLIKTRLLIEASSGGGKSWLMRRLIEIFFGHVQQIVIDPEGEFASLREKFPFVLASGDTDEQGNQIGEVRADPNTADVLCRTILETNASIVIDLSELSLGERKRYVKNFIEALVNAPKELWHPALVYVDEAHDFMPEKGHGESESLGPCIDLATKGRKRGFCAVFLTQRLSKLNKDAAAELKNYLIGNTNLDLDQDRAGDILGFKSKVEKQELRNIEPGIFWASGSIFNSGLRQVKIGRVQSHHPEAGEITGATYVPPPTPQEIKPLLQKLGEIPSVKKRNLEEKRDLLGKITDQQRQIQSLSMKLRNAETNQNVVNPEKVKQIQEKSFDQGFKEASVQLARKIKELELVSLKQQKVLQSISATSAQAAGIELPKFEEIKPIHSQVLTPPVFERKVISTPVSQQVVADSPEEDDEAHLKSGALKMLKAAAQFYPRKISKVQMATLSGFSVTGGTFTDYASKLKLNGLVRISGEEVEITDKGLARAGDVDPLPTDHEELLRLWKPKFKAGVAKMLEVLAMVYPSPISREELGERSGYAISGGTFTDYLSQLRRNRLAIVEGDSVRASPALFLEDQ